jgi:hypothetical protein
MAEWKEVGRFGQPGNAKNDQKFSFRVLAAPHFPR